MTIRHRMDVQAHLLEGQGGMIRILTDAERFGLSVRSINVDAAADDPALLCFSATFVSTTGAIDAAQLAALSGFGHPVGMAFQLRDDVLGVFGDESETGKPSGDDLREGKRTVRVAYTRESLPQGAKTVFDELLGDPALDAGQIDALQRTIVETGALARVEELISAYAQEADRALAGSRLSNAAVGELRDLARAATTRRS